MHALSIAVAALLSSVATGFVVPRKEPPSSYATGYLEDYQQYHTRYLALGCAHKHHSNFFKACCHPMLANETLADTRPSYCIPSSSASASASAAEPTSTVTTPTDDDEGDDNCDSNPSGSSPTSTSESTVSSSTPTSSVAVNVAPSPPPSVSSSHSHTHTKAAPTTTSSSTQAAQTSSAPTTSPNQAPPAPTSSTAQATPTTDASSAAFTGGFGTFFYQNGVAGACGTVHSDSDLIVALDQDRYDSGAHCGQTVAITALGKTVNAVVADDCPTCENENCLDMSVGLFQQFTNLNVGEIDIVWSFV